MGVDLFPQEKTHANKKRTEDGVQLQSLKVKSLKGFVWGIVSSQITGNSVGKLLGNAKCPGLSQTNFLLHSS